MRAHAFGFEALTGDAPALRRRLGEAAVVERASLDEILFLTGRGEA